MRGSLYSTWYRYSLVFQAGTLTLGLSWLLMWFGASLYLEGDWMLPLLLVAGVILFAAGCLFTIAWPAYLMCGLRNRRIPWILTALWILLGFVQPPVGPALAVFQIWCLWKLHHLSPIHTRMLYDQTPPSE